MTNNFELVLKGFDALVVQVDFAFKQLNQCAKGLDQFHKLFSSSGVAVDLGVQIVNDMRVNPCLAE